MGKEKADIAIGVVRGAKGVRGSVKFSPYLWFSGSSKGFPKVLVWKKGEETRTFSVKSWREETRFTVVTLEEISQREEAEALKGGIFLVKEDDLPPLEKDEYYWFQLVGMEVVSDTGEVVGHVKEIMETGGHDVYVVERLDGGEALIPAVKQFVLKIDRQSHRITVRYMEGLW
jgi:16S rRNA processing protein RimM